MFTIDRIEILLLIAAVVSILARRVRLPYTIGLVLTGGAMAVFQWDSGIRVTKELIFTLFLPPLIFEAALAIRWGELKRDIAPLAAMATVGVLLASLCVFAGMHYALGWDWRPALMFGVLISATDPVSVIAMMKEANVQGRLKLLVEGESLLNDGAAAAFFAVALVAVTGEAPTAVEAAGSFLVTAGGGIAVGALVGGACLLLMGRTTDHLVEVTITTVAAFGAFLGAEHLHLSGVLATLVSGLILGNWGPLKALTARGRDDAETFWEFAAFVANSLVFLLMGTRLAQPDYALVWVASLSGIGFVLLGRAVSVYAVCALFARTGKRVRGLHQHILFWGGLRGALALALALALPESLPGRHEVVTVAFAVVAFSVVVQGLTVKPLLARIPADQCD
ncbi:MAG: sodium:proton antiporter [Fimbriimonadaceae bacterium]|nr:sodium:proton antiporter [Fimbriimonadaceae bacterium]